MLDAQGRKALREATRRTRTTILRARLRLVPALVRPARRGRSRQDHRRLLQRSADDHPAEDGRSSKAGQENRGQVSLRQSLRGGGHFSAAGEPGPSSSPMTVAWRGVIENFSVDRAEQFLVRTAPAPPGADDQMGTTARDMAERHGRETGVPDWHARLVWTECGLRRLDVHRHHRTVMSDPNTVSNRATR